MADVILRSKGRTAALVIAFVLLLTTVAFAAGVKAADTSVPAVFIASGENYPDGLVSGSAAAVSGAPVLLTRKDSLPAETIAELVRLHPDKIYVAAGTAAISDAVVTQLQAYAPVVTRLYVSNRYATAVAISEAIFPPQSAASLDPRVRLVRRALTRRCRIRKVIRVTPGIRVRRVLIRRCRVRKVTR